MNKLIKAIKKFWYFVCHRGDYNEKWDSKLNFLLTNGEISLHCVYDTILNIRYDSRTYKILAEDRLGSPAGELKSYLDSGLKTVVIPHSVVMTPYFETSQRVKKIVEEIVSEHKRKVESSVYYDNRGIS